MGKCLICKKTVLGRKRKCKGCKVVNKRKIETNESNITFINNTSSENNENEKEIEEVEEIEENRNETENVLNDNFIEQLELLNLNNNHDNDASSDNEEEENISFFEIDSIHIPLNVHNIPYEEGNLTIYTDPKVFYVKKKMFLKVGWIFFVKSGLQCNVLVNYVPEWSSIYKEIIMNIDDQYKKFFFSMVPVKLDKIVFNKHIGVFLSSFVKTVDKEVILFGRGLKSIINSQYIYELVKSISQNTCSNGRIDFAKTFYNDGDMKFDPQKFKEFIETHNNYKIGKMRLFTQQYSECTSLVASIKQNNVTLGEITCYFHNSIIYRKFFEKNKHTIPSILGKSISDKCKFDYVSKNYFVELIKEFADNCLKQGLIRRIEFRITNFEDVIESISFFELTIQNINKFSIRTSNDFKQNFNIIYFYINNYELITLLNEQILFEELIRVFFLGLDSEPKNNMIELITLKLLLIDIKNKFKLHLNNPTLVYDIDFSITDSLTINRIYNSFCKDKQLFSIFKYICAGYQNQGFDIAKTIIRKVFLKQLLIDYILTCKPPIDQFYSFTQIKHDNEYNIELFVRVNNSLDSNLNFLSTLKNNMMQGSLPNSFIIGECNVLRKRNRDFNNNYSYNSYSKLLLDNFLNVNENITGFTNSQLIIRILFVLFNYVNKYSWGNIYDVFDEFKEYIYEYLFENKFKIFPLYNFTKVHTQNVNGFQWVMLYDDNKDTELEVDSISLIFNKLDLTSNDYFEPYDVYDKIINTNSYPLNCYRLPKLSSNNIFDQYIQKINSKFSKETWDDCISNNRTIVLNNISVYISILRFMLSNNIKHLAFKVTKKKAILALRYLMYISGTIFMKRIAILTKCIRKEEILKILPIFEIQKSRTAILILNEQKFLNFHESLKELSN